MAVKRLSELRKSLDRKEKIVIMLAPSFAAEFEYPDVIGQLRVLGFDKVVELTFGAKIVNREYHSIIKKFNQFWIATVCPGIVEIVLKKLPEFKKNLIPVVSPMVATARVCRKIYPKHKVVFLSPCNFKKNEAGKSKEVDYVLDYFELKDMIKSLKFSSTRKVKKEFDKFYNDYTKIYPLAGGLSKTAHLRGILKEEETRKIDGILDVEKFLKKFDKKVRFLDCTFCKGGCIGGPFLSGKFSLEKRRKKILDYFNRAKHEKIPKFNKGIISRAEGIELRCEY